jgi:hypothetical protein
MPGSGQAVLQARVKPDILNRYALSWVDGGSTPLVWIEFRDTSVQGCYWIGAALCQQIAGVQPAGAWYTLRIVATVPNGYVYTAYDAAGTQLGTLSVGAGPATSGLFQARLGVWTEAGNGPRSYYETDCAYYGTLDGAPPLNACTPGPRPTATNTPTPQFTPTPSDIEFFDDFDSPSPDPAWYVETSTYGGWTIMNSNLHTYVSVQSANQYSRFTRPSTMPLLGSAVLQARVKPDISYRYGLQWMDAAGSNPLVWIEFRNDSLQGCYWAGAALCQQFAPAQPDGAWYTLRIVGTAPTTYSYSAYNASGVQLGTTLTVTSGPQSTSLMNVRVGVWSGGAGNEPRPYYETDCVYHGSQWGAPPLNACTSGPRPTATNTPTPQYTPTPSASRFFDDFDLPTPDPAWTITQSANAGWTIINSNLHTYITVQSANQYINFTRPVALPLLDRAVLQARMKPDIAYRYGLMWTDAAGTPQVYMQSGDNGVMGCYRSGSVDLCSTIVGAQPVGTWYTLRIEALPPNTYTYRVFNAAGTEIGRSAADDCPDRRARERVVGRRRERTALVLRDRLCLLWRDVECAALQRLHLGPAPDGDLHAHAAVHADQQPGALLRSFPVHHA